MKNDGSIYPVKDRKTGKAIPNRWRVEVSFGKNPITGKYERVTKTVQGSKREAGKVRDQIRRDHENGLLIDSHKVTFLEVSLKWFEIKRQNSQLSPNTIRGYSQQIDCLNSYLGKLKIQEIDALTIESLYASLRNDRKGREGKPLSNTSLKRYATIMNQIMQWAENHDLITRNPCKRVSSLKCETPDRRSLERFEAVRLRELLEESEGVFIKSFIEKEERQSQWGSNKQRRSLIGVSDLSYIQAVRIGLSTGARLGEVLALTWGDFDLDQRVLSINKSITSYGEVKAPKTKSSIRRISLDLWTAKKLQEWKEFQAYAMAGLSSMQTQKTPIVCSNVFTFVNHANFEKWWKSWREESGFNGLKFHELRHTQATLLFESGVDIKTVQARGGWASAQIPLDIYAHASPEKDREASDIFGAILQEEKPVLINDYPQLKVVNS